MPNMKDKIDTRGRESARIDDMHLLIEITDYCNCKCIMCKQSMSKTIHGTTPKQYMDLSLFIKIIEDIRESGLKVTSIDPLWGGESTIHPDFKEMMYYLFSVNKAHNLFRGFVLNTNAINMDKELSEIFLDYAKYVQTKKDTNFMRICFSIDAATSVTYEKIKGVPAENFNKAINNISYFLKRRKELGLVLPNLIFAFIVMPENQNESRRFRDLWIDILKDSGVPYEIVASWPLSIDRDSIYYRQLVCHDSKKATELHGKIAFSLGLIKKEALSKVKNADSKQNNFSCGALWRTPNISSNGDVVPCCRDLELKMALGNIKEKSLYDIWHGEEITRLRLLHIKGESDKIEACRYCVEPEAGVLKKEEIIRYLKSINREDLIKI